MKGQAYYFESDFFDYGGGYHAEMAVLVDKTKRTSGQVSGGYDEKQRVQISSVYFKEKQVKDKQKLNFASEVAICAHILTLSSRYTVGNNLICFSVA